MISTRTAEDYMKIFNTRNRSDSDRLEQRVQISHRRGAVASSSILKQKFHIMGINQLNFRQLSTYSHTLSCLFSALSASRWARSCRKAFNLACFCSFAIFQFIEVGMTLGVTLSLLSISTLMPCWRRTLYNHLVPFSHRTMNYPTQYKLYM